MSAGFPTIEKVNAADVGLVLRWNRFLPSPRDDGDVKVIDAVVKRLAELRAQDPAAFTAASKLIGWDR